MQAILHRKYKVFYYHNFLLVFQTQKLGGKKKLIKYVKYKEPGSERDRFPGGMTARPQMPIQDGQDEQPGLLWVARADLAATWTSSPIHLTDTGKSSIT